MGGGDQVKDSGRGRPLYTDKPKTLPTVVQG